MSKKIEVIICIFLIFILLFTLYLKFIKKVNTINVFGYSFFIVRTGSMEPDIKIGELIIVKNSKEYKKDDVITYCIDDACVTHRVVKIEEDKIFTKGDSNNEIDIPIEKNNIIGKVVYHSELLGKIVTEYFKFIIIFYILINIIICFVSKMKSRRGRV